MKNKKAESHIEVIVSFVLFTGFLFFLLYFFNPFKVVGNTENYLDITQKGIEKIINNQVGLTTIKLNTPESGCFKFSYTSEKNIIAKNLSSVTNAGHTPSKISIKGTGENFYFIYFSDDFIENTPSPPCKDLNRENYTIGLFRNYDIISFKSVSSTLQDRYNHDYTNLKQEIGLPQSKNFALEFYSSTRKLLLLNMGKIPEKTTVYVRSVPIEVIYTNGTSINGFMNIHIW